MAGLSPPPRSKELRAPSSAGSLLPLLCVLATAAYLFLVPSPVLSAAWHSPAGDVAKLFLAGAACACLSHAGATPIDVLKTRLQTDPGRYSGLLDAAWKVTKTEGIGMLLQGLGPTAAGYAVHGATAALRRARRVKERARSTDPHSLPGLRSPPSRSPGGLKYGLYELFKSSAAGSATAALSLPLASLLACAACAEVVASTALCPYEAARIRLVADPSFAPGLFPALRRLFSEQGLPGWFGCGQPPSQTQCNSFPNPPTFVPRSALPAMYLKMIPYTCSQLSTYDGVVRWLTAAAVGPGGKGMTPAARAAAVSPAARLLILLASAATAALVASLASQPGDTLLSKLNAGRRKGGAPGRKLSRGSSNGGVCIGGSGGGDDAVACGVGAGSGIGGGVANGGGLGGSGGHAMTPPIGGDDAGEEDGGGEGGAGANPHKANLGCGHMWALAARLGPAGLMTGWAARLAHTGTIVCVQVRGGTRMGMGWHLCGGRNVALTPLSLLFPVADLRRHQAGGGAGPGRRRRGAHTAAACRDDVKCVASGENYGIPKRAASLLEHDTL